MFWDVKQQKHSKMRSKLTAIYKGFARLLETRKFATKPGNSENIFIEKYSLETQSTDSDYIISQYNIEIDWKIPISFLLIIHWGITLVF